MAIKCPDCGCDRFRTVAIMAVPAFGGDTQCRDCQNVFWKCNLAKQAKGRK